MKKKKLTKEEEALIKKINIENQMLELAFELGLTLEELEQEFDEMEDNPPPNENKK